ncbi:MAG: OsmC family protein [Idiomarina sp.]|nr:OsmC family protein [Idiomarina sp.]
MSQSKTIAIDAYLESGFAIKSIIDGHEVIIDQPKSAKGTGLGPSPLQHFLFAIGGCIGTVARIIAFQKKIDLQGMKIQVAGDYNPAGLMGKASDDRVGFQQIRVSAVIDSDISQQEKEQFLQEVCARCPLHDNVVMTTNVVHKVIALDRQSAKVKTEALGKSA